MTRQSTGSASTFKRVLQYTLVRGAALLLMVMVSVYLIISIANLGGYLDEIIKGSISEDINARLYSGWLRDASPEERQRTIDETRQSMEAFYNLDQPYLLRSANWFVRAITLNWGKSRFNYVISSTYVNGVHVHDEITDDVHTEILTCLPRTLFLLGTSYLGVFLISILIALSLARRTGSWVDRLMVALAPISSVPGWMFGLLLYILFIRVFKIYNFSPGYEWRSSFQPTAISNLFLGMALPVLAISLSKLFQSIYSWRTYFLMYSNENYIELAKAKGLSKGVLDRRYLLRPALPSIITSVTLMMIVIWQDCIAVEYFFTVGGIGGLFMQALNNSDIIVIVSLTTVFAYFLAITVFILDFVYALADPRIKIANETQEERSFGSKSRLSLRFPQRFKKLGDLQEQPSLLENGNKPVTTKTGLSKTDWLRHAWQRNISRVHDIKEFIREITRYPSATVGMVIILILSLISIYTVIAIPYSKAISLWRGDNQSWIRNPIRVPPAWTNLFRKEKLPENIDLDSQAGGGSKSATVDAHGNDIITISFHFDYLYSSYPQDILVLFKPRFETNRPFVSMTWITPDGKEIPIKNTAIGSDSLVLFSKDREIINKFQKEVPVAILFNQPNAPTGKVLKGKYELKITGVLFDKGSDLDAEMVVYGQVYGIAGTDLNRRDLSLVLLWGTVAALSFGVLAALGTTLCSVTLAAAGAWFRGWIDGLIQRVSEINMVLPLLSTSILVFYLYSKSFWVILGVTVGLSIFGNSLKNYRAIFLQLREAPYIEAARTYGASSWRIIFQYLVPRIRTVLIPQLVILVPSYIFYEATLSFLGVSDPFLPTLGKLLVSTIQGSMYKQPLYLFMEPVVMLVLIGLGFALFGFALERFYHERAGG